MFFSNKKILFANTKVQITYMACHQTVITVKYSNKLTKRFRYFCCFLLMKNFSSLLFEENNRVLDIRLFCSSPAPVSRASSTSAHPETDQCNKSIAFCRQ